jgi:hypothetical protein
MPLALNRTVNVPSLTVFVSVKSRQHTRGPATPPTVLSAWWITAYRR